MTEDFEWFEKNYQEFQSIYGNSYLAIKNRQVIGVYTSFGDGVRETLKTEKPGTFIVQECRTDRIAYMCHIASMNFA